MHFRPGSPCPRSLRCKKISLKRPDDRQRAHSTCFCAGRQSDTDEAPGLGPEVLGLGPVTVTKIVSRLVGVEEEDDCPSLA